MAALEDFRPVIAGVCDRPGSVLGVAVDEEDQVLAFAVAALAVAAEGADNLDGTAEIEYVGVRPGRWGTGLARQVLELLGAELARDGFTGAQLMVYVSNRRAIGVYEHLGWRAQGTPRPHRRTGKPEQRYCRKFEW